MNATPAGHGGDTPDERPGPAHPNTKILVVEDESALRELMRLVLEKEGHSVIATDDGAKGLETLLEQPDIPLVLLNLLMPRMPGEEFLARILELPARQRPTVIVVTGKVPTPEPSDWPAGLVAAVLRKPYKQTELLERVRSVLQSRATSGGGEHLNSRQNGQQSSGSGPAES